MMTFDLGLQKIADHLNMHPAYLSSSFKERCGEGISENYKGKAYKIVVIIGQRLFHKRNGKKAGYINVRTFSAAFRRYYGKNPSSIRKKLKGAIFMKLKYLGTSAAEGIPPLHADAGYAKKARRLKGRYVRTRSQAMINNDMLLDFNSDSYGHFFWQTV